MDTKNYRTSHAQYMACNNNNNNNIAESERQQTDEIESTIRHFNS